MKESQGSTGHTLRTTDPVYAQGIENLFPLDCYFENTLSFRSFKAPKSFTQ